jgi:hypothetical protein
MANISRPPNPGSLSPDELSREPDNRAMHNFSSSPVKQERQSEIKTEEISHGSPKQIKIESTGGIPQSRDDGPATTIPFGSM